MQLQVQPLRRPLQPKNTHWRPEPEPEPEPKPKPKPIEIRRNAGKENRPIEAVGPPLEASLAEELRAVRRRRERLRLAKEETERLLRERERMLGMRAREMEMRWEKQKEMEVEIQRILWIMDLRSCTRDGPTQSLRAEEEEKRDAQLKEASRAESSNGSRNSGQLSPQERGADGSIHLSCR